MERVRQSIDIARNALLTLEEILTLDVSSDIIRDAAIQRFEYTFEAVWKAGKRFLLEIEGVDAGHARLLRLWVDAMAQRMLETDGHGG